jgi:TRAP-type mannitol/chloroaromatic compound transport system substrate-binding protein
MVRKRCLSLVVSAVTLSLVFLVSGIPAHSAGKTISWKAQSAWHRGDAFHNEAEFFCEALKKTSSGKLVIPKIFAVGELVGPIEAMTETAAGRLDLTHNSGMYVAGTLLWTGLSIGSRPGYANESVFSSLRYLYYGGGLDLYNEYIQTKFNLYSLPVVCTASEAVYSMKPLRKLSDFKGLKIRTSGLNKMFFEALGATCISIPMTDVTPAMQRGELDACEMSSFYIDSKSGIEDIAKYVLTGTIHQPVGITVQVFINLDTWNALPENLKQAVKDAAELSMWHSFVYGGYMDQVIAEKWWNKMEMLEVTPEMQKGFVKATEKVRENIMVNKDPWGAKILKHEKAFMDKFDKYAVEPW